MKDILKSGFWPRYCLEDVSWYGDNEAQSAYPIVCFCDIPLSRVDEHVDFYGDFGIGVTKEWAKCNRLSPVIYINEGSEQHFALKKLFHGNLIGNGYYGGSADDINNLLSHIKQTEGKMLVNGEFIQKEFHQENEWRYAVNGKATELNVMPFLYRKRFDTRELLEDQNAKSKENYSLRVSPSDIKYLFVKNDSDIPELMDFIQTQLGHYTNSDIKILMSRVISLETISRDM